MILFDPQGWAVNSRIKAMHFAGLQHGKMTKVAGIIVHQTGAPTAASTLAQYKRPGSNGAHFLIDKDGSIIQTASVLAKIQHVGPVYIRCLIEHRCHPVEMKTVMGLSSYTKARSGGLYEFHNKEVPQKIPIQ